MTFSFFRREKARTPRGVVRALQKKPTLPTVGSVSVVIPVRDNQQGIERILRWWSALGERVRPRELIIVDDGSEPAISLGAQNCRVIRARGNGPASARNIGWRLASGDWIAFIDSDCVPDDGWPSQFANEWNGEVAAQGRVRSLGTDTLSNFYESQGILRPMTWSAEGRPDYLITANALVWKAALEAVGGFDERFPYAAGEDVELGLRLSEIGEMRWCEAATVAHDFEPTLSSFVRRFVRYGRGNRLLAFRAERLEGHLVPRPFRARSGLFVDHMLAAVAFGCLTAGWVMESFGTE